MAEINHRQQRFLLGVEILPSAAKLPARFDLDRYP